MITPDAQTSDTLSPEATAAALATSAACRWWQVTAFLEIAGPDALTLLDGLCTQAVERIEIGTGVLGLFLDAKAKIIAPAILHRTPNASWTDPRRATTIDDSPRLLLELPPDLIEPLQSHLTRYRLRAKVTIEPVDIATIAVMGSDVESVQLPPLARDGSWSEVVGAGRPTRAALSDPATCSTLVDELLPQLGVLRAAPDALEADRIDERSAGLHDLLPGRMPAEVGGMDHAVALDAGCYLGQEPVARLHYRGRANRTLRRVELVDAHDTLASGTDDLDEQLALRRLDDAADARAVGRITTWARRPDGVVCALAVLRRELVPGDELRHTTSGVLARVLDPVADADSDA